MQRSDSITKIAAALVKAQGQLQIAVKDSTNPAFRSRYADLGSVWDACRAALQDNGLSVVQLPFRSEPGHAALETVLLHESGEYISGVAETRLVKDDPQGYGSAITYLRRYALSAMLGIVADDDDGNHASGVTPNGPQRALPLNRPL
ncbi:ERF family protein, partial [Deinococcus pimensis]|uniref:ERF family protein n=1 Tax=Deinococcus pimensis TaxID=309888 RepID=UPI001FDEF415